MTGQNIAVLGRQSFAVNLDSRRFCGQQDGVFLRTCENLFTHRPTFRFLRWQILVYNQPVIVSGIPIKDIIGIILCAIAYAVKWYGSYTFLPVEYHILSLPLFISGLTIIIFNFQTLRVLIFPIAFLIFLLPPPLNIIQILGSNLSVFSSQASYAITKSTGIPVDLSFYYDSPIIYLTTSSGQEISLTIDVACSGLYSLIGFALFAFFLAYITRGPLKNKALTLLTGFPVIYLLHTTIT